MTTSLLRALLLLTVAPVLASCSSPICCNDKEIERAVQEQLRSVQGRWRGLQSAASGDLLSLEFSLTQQANNEVHGTGTMKESSTASPVPITVTGTFHRPTLALKFEGMVYEGRSVTGEFREDYVTVGGLYGPLRLTAEGYGKNILVLLQEN